MIGPGRFFQALVERFGNVSLTVIVGIRPNPQSNPLWNHYGILSRGTPATAKIGPLFVDACQSPPTGVMIRCLPGGPHIPIGGVFDGYSGSILLAVRCGS